jgi:hypothetical protein
MLQTDFNMKDVIKAGMFRYRLEWKYDIVFHLEVGKPLQ